MSTRAFDLSVEAALHEEMRRLADELPQAAADREGSQRLLDLWPEACCDVAVAALLEMSPLLAALGARERTGAWRDGEDLRSHCWIELSDETIVDPTYGQFDGGPNWRVFAAEDDHQLVATDELTEAEQEAAFSYWA